MLREKKESLVNALNWGWSSNDKEIKAGSYIQKGRVKAGTAFLLLNGFSTKRGVLTYTLK